MTTATSARLAPSARFICAPARAAHRHTATWERLRRPALAGTHWVTSATLTPTDSFTCPTAASICLPSAVATSTQPRWKRRCLNTLTSCRCLVVGVPDSDLGQVPDALVQSSEDSHLDKETVRTFLAERVAAYKVPKTIEFVHRPVRDQA